MRQRVQDKGDIGGVDWPHPWLGRTGKVPHKSLVVVLADTNVGKSSFGLWLVEQWARRGVQAGFISCEDPEEKVAEKVSSWDEGALKRAYLVSLDEDPRIDSVLSAYDTMSRAGAQVVFIDYLQILDGSDSTAPRHEQVANMALRMKAHAKRHQNVCVLASQITKPTRKAGDFSNTSYEFPTTDMVAESKKVATMADFMISLRRGEAKRTVEGLVIKSKWSEIEGPIGTFHVKESGGGFVGSGPGSWSDERVESLASVSLSEWDVEGGAKGSRDNQAVHESQEWAAVDMEAW